MRPKPRVTPATTTFGPTFTSPPLPWPVRVSRSVTAVQPGAGQFARFAVHLGFDSGGRAGQGDRVRAGLHYCAVHAVKGDRFLRAGQGAGGGGIVHVASFGTRGESVRDAETWR